MGNANVREGRGKIVEEEAGRSYPDTDLASRHGQPREACRLNHDGSHESMGHSPPDSSGHSRSPDMFDSQSAAVNCFPIIGHCYSILQGIAVWNNHCPDMIGDVSPCKTSRRCIEQKPKLILCSHLLWKNLSADPLERWAVVEEIARTPSSRQSGAPYCCGASCWEMVQLSCCSNRIESHNNRHREFRYGSQSN